MYYIICRPIISGTKFNIKHMYNDPHIEPLNGIETIDAGMRLANLEPRKLGYEIQELLEGRNPEYSLLHRALLIGLVTAGRMTDFYMHEDQQTLSTCSYAGHERVEIEPMELARKPFTTPYLKLPLIAEIGRSYSRDILNPKNVSEHQSMNHDLMKFIIFYNLMNSGNHSIKDIDLKYHTPYPEDIIIKNYNNQKTIIPRNKFAKSLSEENVLEKNNPELVNKMRDLGNLWAEVFIPMKQAFWKIYPTGETFRYRAGEPIQIGFSHGVQGTTFSVDQILNLAKRKKHLK